MTVSEKHAEWISLLEVSGPFLAVSVLEDAFPQGLDKVETLFRQRIRSAYDEWLDAIDGDDPQLDAIHREWVSLVVRDFLEYDASVLRSGEAIPASLAHHDVASDTTFRPDFAVMSGDRARLLISVTAPGTRLDDPLPSDTWLASPAERLIQLCRTSGVPLGIVTNGERWMVVSAPADGGSSRASWYARLWLQEPVTLQAFASLLGVRRCFGEDSHTLDALIRRSLEHQDEITDTLGEQVRRAVEVLVQALDRADQDRNRMLLQDVTPAQLFEAGLTVMMRLVVLLCAEERKLLLLGEPVYDQNYAITTLRAQLVEQASHGLEILERRQDAWSRLLATFRGIYGGIHHETLRLPPLGGSLFDPDRFPFLEGRAPGTRWHDTAASPLPIDNRTVLLLLNALQVLEHKSGAQMLSYEALDVEQIGHVYEGLLERTVKRVPEVTLGLMANSTVHKKTGHPELPLSALEETARSGRSALVEFLNETTGRSKSALTKDLELPLKPSATNRLLLACGNDLTLMERVRPFGQLLRTDSWEDPLVYPQDAFIVTHGVGRRETGSHYTPKSLTEPIVRHTLEPLVYLGPAEGVPRAEWKLKAPDEILVIKVCDMAMGSGAFLVQSCRYLADRLVEAWNAEETGGRVISIEGVVLERVHDVELLPRDKAERVLIARRLIASRCLYGVDINPMAVELAKLSLWLVTMMKGRPFNFLDHALKCGDSLLGVSSIQQIENFSLRPGDRQMTFATANLHRHIEDAAEKRRRLEELPSNDHTQIETKNRLHAESEAATAKVKAVADCLIALELQGLDGKAYEDHRTAEAEKVQLLMKRDANASFASQTPTINYLSAYAHEQLEGRRLFHWAVEFPEVFARGGFDGYVGNPPFLGGSRITGVHGTPFRDFLIRHLAWGVAGKVDLCTYFFLRAFDSLRTGGTFGLLATNSIAQGDARVAGLEQILRRGGNIYRAIPNQQWPGTANVEVAAIWIRKGAWLGEHVLGLKSAFGISSYLFEQSEEKADPARLAANAKLVFRGSEVRGEGFILDSDAATELLAARTLNQQVIFPYLSGEDLNTRPDQSPGRWIINFHDWDWERASRHPECLAILTEKVKPYRDTITKQVHESDYWKFWDKRLNEYARIENMPRVLATAKVSPTNAVAWVKPGIVFHEKVVIFPLKESWAFAVMQSSFHWEWVRFYTSTLGATTLNYSPTDCFETFPFPGASPLILSASAADPLNNVSENFYAERGRIMLARNIGLTKTYNRFHDPQEQSADIARLRELHIEMDQTVAAAYGWSDLDLGHGFHVTKHGERFTISDTARRNVLDRLLALNHERYAEEVAAGIHDKKKGKGGNSPKRQSKAAISDPELDFGTARAATPPKPWQFTEAKLTRPSSRSSSAIGQTELLNAIFTCAARREFTDREEFAKEVSALLGFQRLREKTRALIASAINSAIRRGLIAYDGAWIVRRASSLSDLDTNTLVKAINAAIRPGCAYTVDEVLHAAADHLGCLRLREPLREALQSALTTASRRGLITKRGQEVRKA